MGNSSHHMVDIETLDTAKSAVVLSIGAVAFDPSDWTITGEFHLILDVDSQMAVGRTRSASTMQWWAQQSDAARTIFDAPKIDTREALRELALFLDGTQGVWGNGSDFDNVIIGSLYESFGMRVPWSFGLNRCHRTMKNFQLPKEYIKPARLGTHHDALDDARYQFIELRNICAALHLSL